MFKRCLNTECNHVCLVRADSASSCPVCRRKKLNITDYFKSQDSDDYYLNPINRATIDKAELTIDEIYVDYFYLDITALTRKERIKIGFYLRYAFGWMCVTVYRNKKQKNIWREGPIANEIKRRMI